jgi:hypothetical protein
MAFLLDPFAQANEAARGEEQDEHESEVNDVHENPFSLERS